MLKNVWEEEKDFKENDYVERVLFLFERFKFDEVEKEEKLKYMCFVEDVRLNECEFCGGRDYRCKYYRLLGDEKK